MNRNKALMALICAISVTILTGCQSSPSEVIPNWSGEWLRSDGTYQLKVQADENSVYAEYFNPSPINVETAEFIEKTDGRHLKVVLRDRGYPGAIYDLAYHAEPESLDGTYFNPNAGQTYTIQFYRQ